MTYAGRSDFFAREAGDYLRDLEPLVGGGPPQGETLVRLARALRGAAMLAGPGTFTAAATEVEQIAKQVRDGTQDWDAVAPRLRRAVGELRRLAAAAAAWDEARDREATSVADELRGASRTAVLPAETAPRTSEPGLRAFVAREAAAVAGAVELAARALAGASSPPIERLAAVTRAMQSLRGVAGLGQLTPLADLLDVIDAAVAEVERGPVVPAMAPDLFFAAAGALGRVAREVAELGQPDPDLPEALRVADMMFGLLAGPEGIVPIETLLTVGATGPVQPYGGRADGPARATALDLASLGDCMRQAADQIRSAPSPAPGRLQQVLLLRVLREAPGGLGTRPAGEFVQRVLGFLEDTACDADATRLADLLEQGGTRISEGARGDQHALVRDLEALAQDLIPAPVADADVVPIESLLAADEPFGLAEVEEEPVPIASLAPDPVAQPPADRTSLERSLSAYSRLVQAGAPAPPLAAHAPAPEPTEVDLVPIEDLLYSGRAALLRADQVRRELEAALRQASDRREDVEQLVREILDLVPLALADER